MQNEYKFKSELFIPAPINKVFDFFSKAENLEAITPPFLKFKVITPAPIEMKKGTLIDYKLKIHGIPLKWRTLIAEWEPGVRFADTQLKGPYKLWYHTHEFKEVTGGTLMTDTVRYIPPFGILGKLVHPIFIKPDVEKIFAYRNSTISVVFKPL